MLLICSFFRNWGNETMTLAAQLMKAVCVCCFFFFVFNRRKSMPEKSGRLQHIEYWLAAIYISYVVDLQFKASWKIEFIMLDTDMLMKFESKLLGSSNEACSFSYREIASYGLFLSLYLLLALPTTWSLIYCKHWIDKTHTYTYEVSEIETHWK